LTVEEKKKPWRCFGGAFCAQTIKKVVRLVSGEKKKKKGGGGNGAKTKKMEGEKKA